MGSALVVLHVDGLGADSLEEALREGLMPFTKHLMSSGVVVDYHPQPESEHNTRWWPEVKDSFESFVADHPRSTPRTSRLEPRR